MELLSLAVLIDSLVFMSKVEGSISSISGGGWGCCHGMTHFSVSHVFCLFFLILLFIQKQVCLSAVLAQVSIFQF